jgi:hypothetical protein
VTDTANNDRPSETPKPPEGYETWLDFALDCALGSLGQQAARAELSALRAKAAAYDEAMAKIADVLAHWDSTADEKMYLALKDYVRDERDSGRFKP